MQWLHRVSPWTSRPSLGPLSRPGGSLPRAKAPPRASGRDPLRASPKALRKANPRVIFLRAMGLWDPVVLPVRVLEKRVRFGSPWCLQAEQSCSTKRS